MASNIKMKMDLVDFHSHILPGADHGSDSIDTTLFQLNSAMVCGIDRIIATPHFYPNIHTVEDFLSRRNSSYEALMPHLNASFPKIRLGAEVLICDGIENLPDLDKLFVQGTNTLLLELPFAPFTEEHTYSVDKLISRGVNVIIAHADRYLENDIDKMIECGAKLQLNAVSINTVFRRKCISNWLNRNLVVALGSDIHNKDKRALQAFCHAVSRLGDKVDFIQKSSDKVWSSSIEYSK